MHFGGGKKNAATPVYSIFHCAPTAQGALNSCVLMNSHRPFTAERLGRFTVTQWSALSL